MPEIRIELTRGDLVESVHRVTAVVVNSKGRPLASSGDPARVAFWRSAAKPFQALPLLLDGAADAFGITDEELALACASHSSEPKHLAVAAGLLQRIGGDEESLACGPHPPLSSAVAEQVLREGVPLTPIWSNCSGNHLGMLALALHHGWPAAGYQRAGHPVQERLLVEVARWTGVPRASIPLGVDGCTTVTFALPLGAMALAYARLAVTADPAVERLRGALYAHPELVAGSGRLCTELMAAWPGRVIAKAGAAGIYCAALPELELGLALKIEDGDGASAPVALLALLRAVIQHVAADRDRYPFEPLARHAGAPVANTRGAAVGRIRPAGAPRFLD